MRFDKKLVRELMEKKGFGIPYMAAKMYSSDRTVERILNTGDTGVDYIGKIAHILDVDPAMILDIPPTTKSDHNASSKSVEVNVENLVAECARHEMTLAQASRHAGLKESTVHYMAGGRASIEFVEAFADAFHIPVEELIDGER